MLSQPCASVLSMFRPGGFVGTVLVAVFEALCFFAGTDECYSKFCLLAVLIRFFYFNFFSLFLLVLVISDVLSKCLQGVPYLIGSYGSLL